MSTDFLGNPDPQKLYVCAFLFFGDFFLFLLFLLLFVFTSRHEIIAFTNFSKESVTQGEKKNHSRQYLHFLFFQVNFYLHSQELFPNSDQSTGQGDESNVIFSGSPRSMFPQSYDGSFWFWDSKSLQAPPATPACGFLSFSNLPRTIATNSAHLSLFLNESLYISSYLPIRIKHPLKAGMELSTFLACVPSISSGGGRRSVALYAFFEHSSISLVQRRGSGICSGGAAHLHSGTLTIQRSCLVAPAIGFEPTQLYLLAV